MRVALADEPVQRKKVPSQIVQARIDRSSGLLTYKADETSRFEYFLRGTAPTEYEPDSSSDNLLGGDLFSGQESSGDKDSGGGDDLLF
ncbi:multimodular transpeptidase-transglycosylase [Vibrio ishigakensis]|uniref:Multimodular transpeptidase-transglycosylase n=1 Tax=Vibrio ishigakensis TaxID=1481914 RepID=A0A0B8PGJ3_9VIBR|nr:multimodular transpeptidase-transglycosylase [Vibrio ishigakensis]